MVVGDLGVVEMADAHFRLQKKFRASDNNVHVCTANYRPPDVHLGSQRFQEDIDMWSFGCVAAELYSRQPFIAPAAASGKSFVDAIAAIVGRPGQEAVADAMPACAASWLEELPFDPDLLRYLQTCPSWNSLAENHWKRAHQAKCVRADEDALGFKSEFPGFVDEENPPKCRALNKDRDLQPIPSERVAAFVRAIRKKWRPWLQQLGGKMREAVRADSMPETIYQLNGQPIMQEDFADNAFAYASAQLMQPGVRDDGWHTDGGCSLLHAATTLFGTRSVEVKVEGKPQVTLYQEPGSFYVGNLSALEHNVRHLEECKHTFEGTAVTAKGDQRLQIAVMIRCDVFREYRARKIDSTPGPAEFFRVVNYTVAQHLTDVPVALPDLTEVLAEVARTESVMDELARP